MKNSIRAFPVCLICLAAASQCQAQDIWWGQPSLQARIYQSQVNVGSSVNDTYFCLVRQNYGYGGIQQGNSSSSLVGIFSIWDQLSDPAGDYEESTVLSYNPTLSLNTVGRFGGEGTGVQFIYNYPWQTGVNYRCAWRTSLEPDGIHLRQSGFLYDDTLKTWQYIATFRANISQSGAGPYLGGPMDFMENYGGTTGTRQSTFGNNWWYDTSGSWTEMLGGSPVNVQNPDSSGNYGSVTTAATGVLFQSSPTTTYNAPSSLTYTAPVTDAPYLIPYQVSCGSDSASGSFEPDGYFNSGGEYSTGTTVTTTGVSSPAPVAVYQHCRYNSDIVYTLVGLRPSTNYQLRLHFAEIIGDAVGKRLENVLINGSQVLTNFDINATAGGVNKAVVEQFTAQPNSSGVITVEVKASSTSTDWAASINGIEATEVPLFQVNCGGSAVSPYTADAGSSGGSGTLTTTHSISTSGVTNPAPASVYQSYRYGSNFSYSMTGLAANTNYVVRLHFAESYDSAAGVRLFNVALNGTTVLSNFDVFAAAGGEYKAVVKQFTVASDSTGKITVGLTHSSGSDPNAIINGIQIQRP